MGPEPVFHKAGADVGRQGPTLGKHCPGAESWRTPGDDLAPPPQVSEGRLKLRPGRICPRSQRGHSQAQTRLFKVTRPMCRWQQISINW